MNYKWMYMTDDAIKCDVMGDLLPAHTSFPPTTALLLPPLLLPLLHQMPLPCCYQSQQQTTKWHERRVTETTVCIQGTPFNYCQTKSQHNDR